VLFFAAPAARAATHEVPIGEVPNYASVLNKRLEMVNAVIQRGPYHANWHSLEQWQVPTWYRNAKFGMFIHWGVYSVPAFQNEWYSRNMYIRGSAAYKHQVATYGPEKKFGYKNFIPMFTGNHFAPDAWMKLFREAGARYVVPVAEHCDGFAMYNSDLTHWDAYHMGPKQDVIGEEEKAAKRAGLHFGASSHRAEHWWWYDGGTKFDSDVRNPKYAGLYGPAEPESLPGEATDKAPDPNHLERWLPPSRAFMRDWLGRTTEIIDKYHPQILYLDWWAGQPAFRPYLKKLAAYYYDRAAQWGTTVVLTYKDQDYPPGAALLDIERGKMDQIRLLPWQTDTSVSIHSWGYVKHDTYRTSKSLIDELVDVVSKNGDMLLNVGPKSGGTIPAQARRVLLAMGGWLRMNGQAIYGTRPWYVYGEGPTISDRSRHRGADIMHYTAQDVRFTRKGNVLYAIELGWPASRELTLHTLFKGSPYIHGTIRSISLLGSAAHIAWKQTPDGLMIPLPTAKPNNIAYVFKITFATK
jgi:alpha-L-fucosidase